MTRRSGCPHEQDVLDLVVIGRWPDGAETSLADHVAGCNVCADAAHTASALSVLGDQSRAIASVPDATLVWVGAKIRTRDEAVRRIGRPLLVAEAAAAILAAVATVWWGLDRAWPDAALGWLEGLEWSRSAFSGPAEGAWRATRWLVAGLGVSAALVSVALYVALLADREPRDQKKTSPTA